MGIVELEIGLRNQDNVEACPGKATAVLPIKGGNGVPYPFQRPS